MYVYMYVCKMVVVVVMAALGGKKTIAVCGNCPGLEIESKVQTD
jgi:hypothetical protein